MKTPESNYTIVIISGLLVGLIAGLSEHILGWDFWRVSSFVNGCFFVIALGEWRDQRNQLRALKRMWS